MKKSRLHAAAAVSFLGGVIIAVSLSRKGTGTPGAGETGAPTVVALRPRVRVKPPAPRRLSVDNVDRVSTGMRHLQDSGAIMTLDEIYELGEHLLYEDRLALYEWVRTAETDEETLYLKDELFNQLERQEAFPEEYAEQLSNMALDQSLDSDLRGYILQHLRLNYGRFSDFQKAFVLDTFYETLKESGNDAGGTALINLTEFIKKGHQIDSETVREAAYTQAFEQSESVANRVTAVQCCVELGITGINSQLRTIMENDQNPVGLKLSAAAALASVAAGEENTYLAMLSVKDNGIYKKAVENNLK